MIFGAGADKTINSGSLAGPGSYLGLAADNTLILTSSAGGGATIANDANNRITTAKGDGTLNGEANLTFDGTHLKLTGVQHITGSLELTGSGQSLLRLHTRDADNLKEIVFLKDGSAAAAMQINSAEHLFIENEAAKDIILRANNQNALRVIGSQRKVIVGAVTRTAANAHLDVEGSAVISGSLIVSGAADTPALTTVIDQNHISSSLPISGSFFFGDGGGLTNLPSAAISTYNSSGQ